MAGYRSEGPPPTNDGSPVTSLVLQRGIVAENTWLYAVVGLYITLYSLLCSIPSLFSQGEPAATTYFWQHAYSHLTFGRVWSIISLWVAALTFNHKLWSASDLVLIALLLYYTSISDTSVCVWGGVYTDENNSWSSAKTAQKARLATRLYHLPDIRPIKTVGGINCRCTFHSAEDTEAQQRTRST